ncbi:hypothetical protein RFI_24964 [Reticulomyxa filosa]|uniref:Spermatogenesis-associated protein 20 n=1 Tax=Reticulomyxa filosa TaxID=46433 RepID=X6MG87_RETFI|nr:hypothetical protein RFI_24964 [Reticulomyxa filosa]|eukprot:ETO12412.1 hypothetical protein RFI_24964 [Reticulomyxa filosa]
MAISAFANAHKVFVVGESNTLKDSPYLQAAIRAASFIKRELCRKDNKHLLRNYRKSASTTEGFSSDYSSLIQGLLDLYEATVFDAQWLEWSIELQDLQLQLFYDETSGGFFESLANDPYVLFRSKEEYDGAEPASSTVAVQNMLRLYSITHQKKFCSFVFFSNKQIISYFYLFFSSRFLNFKELA